MCNLRPQKTTARCLVAPLALVLVLVVLTLPVWSRDPIFSCFFAGTTTSGNLFVATSNEDLSGSHRVVLYGVTVPARAEGAFTKYVQKMVGGYLLHVRVHRKLEDKSIPAMVGEVMIVQGRDYVNFNKAVLRDGYGVPSPDAPPSYQAFASYARRKQLGIWASGRPRWIVPTVTRTEKQEPTGAVTDRDKTISKYGIPNYSNRTLIPDNYSILQYHIYITDFYLSIGQVFIYRDGKLVNRQAYGK